MKTRRIRVSLCALATAFVLCSAAFAQSLDPRNPAPLQPGTNSGILDSNTGPHYYYYWGGPGEVTITITHVAGGAEVTMELYDEAKTQGVAHAMVTSLAQSSSRHLSANLKKESKWIVAIRFPDTGGVRLLRATAGYELVATGAVRFDKRPTGPGLIVGTYMPRVIYNDESSAVKFKPDGTLEFASGTVGTWKLFDENTMIYTVTFLNNRLSLKLMPGQGLVNPADGSLVFQATK
jgi:hypothetical protein